MAMSTRQRSYQRRMVPELVAARHAREAALRAALAYEDALLAAAEAGASLRQIGEATDSSASTVLRAIQRAERRASEGAA
jgi:hypothetical protein